MNLFLSDSGDWKFLFCGFLGTSNNLGRVNKIKVESLLLTLSGSRTPSGR
jgi:hypothetical protein